MRIPMISRLVFTLSAIGLSAHREGYSETRFLVSINSGHFPNDAHG